MKKTKGDKIHAAQNETMRSEYHFDYATAKPNRFATRMKTDAVAVLLDADVAEYFPDEQSVNSALRSLVRIARTRVRTAH